MSTAVAIELVFREPLDDVDRRIREVAEWFDRQGEHSSGYHEVIAYLAMVKARQHWRLADMYAGMERRAAERQAKAAARLAAKQQPVQAVAIDPTTLLPHRYRHGL